MTEKTEISIGEGNEQRSITVRCLAASNKDKPGLVWLGGYRSDMMGTKAVALEDWAKSAGTACCRHDYSGHGESGGAFRDGSISRWTEESLAVFDQFCEGPQILVGSSMGAWVALRMVQILVERGEQSRLAGLLLLAPAPDFTHELMWPGLSDSQKTTLETQGFLEEPSEYSDEPNIYTKLLFDDGEENRVMKGIIDVPCPVHIIQGMQDPDVPYQHAMKLVNHLPQSRVTMSLIKDGDHRLSRPEDIEMILRIVEQMSAASDG